MDHCVHVVKKLTRKCSGPDLWKRKEFWSVRECVSVITSNPEKCKSMSGDFMPDCLLFENNGYLEIRPTPYVVDMYVGGGHLICQKRSSCRLYLLQGWDMR